MWPLAFRAGATSIQAELTKYTLHAVTVDGWGSVGRLHVGHNQIDEDHEEKRKSNFQPRWQPLLLLLLSVCTGKN